MTVKYTPGPWAIEDPMGPETPWIVEANKPTHEWRCIAILETDDFSPAEARANHKLLVAAPTMAEALLKVARAGTRDEQLVALAAAKHALEEAGIIPDNRPHPTPATSGEPTHRLRHPLTGDTVFVSARTGRILSQHAFSGEPRRPYGTECDKHGRHLCHECDAAEVASPPAPADLVAARQLWEKLHRYDPIEAIEESWAGVHPRLREEFDFIAAALAAVREEASRKATNLLEARKSQWGDEYNRGHRCSLTVQNELDACIRALSDHPQPGAGEGDEKAGAGSLPAG